MYLNYLAHLQSAHTYNYGILIIIVYGSKYLEVNVYLLSNVYGVDEMPIVCVMFSRSSEHSFMC